MGDSHAKIEVHPPADFIAVRRRDNRANRKKVAALRGMLNGLSYADPKPNSRQWLRCRALEWSLGVIEEWMTADPLFTVLWTGTEFTDNASLQDLLDMLGTEVVVPFEVVPLRLKPSNARRRCEVLGVRFVSSQRQAVELTLRMLNDTETVQRPQVEVRLLTSSHTFASDDPAGLCHE